MHSGTGNPPDSLLGQSNSPLKPRRTAGADSFETGQLRRPEHWNMPWLTHYRLPEVRFGKIFDTQRFCRWKKKVNSTGSCTGWYYLIGTC